MYIFSEYDHTDIVVSGASQAAGSLLTGYAIRFLADFIRPDIGPAVHNRCIKTESS